MTRELGPVSDRTLAGTIEPDTASEERQGWPHLIVFTRDTSAMVPLVGEGQYVVGRADDVAVPIADRTVSRRHAVIEVRGGVATIEDQGSSFGTSVNTARITQATRLSSGDVIRVGNTQLVFQWFGARLGLTGRPLDGEQFVQRVAAEVERSLRYLHPLALLLLSFEGEAPTLATSVARVLRTMDSVGPVAPQTLGVLLPELETTTAPLVGDRIIKAVRQQVPSARIGLACWPDDGCDAETLFVAARGALERVVPGRVATATEAVRTCRLRGREVVFADPAVVRVVSLAERLAQTQLPILILGETGVGKEVFASLVHELSPRAQAPFVALNCAALPESLVESELFGHARGAFTGAEAARSGHIRSAHGGTLFLDEIGELPLAVQAKPLRVLDERLVMPLGSDTAHAVDLRLVAATNRDLGTEVEAGRFRRDLYYRLGGAILRVPPLRERPREIPLLSRALLEAAAQRTQKEPLRITVESMRLLAGYRWPGNVRELVNVLERAQALATGPMLEAWMLPDEIHGRAAESPASAAEAGLPDPMSTAPSTFRPLDDELRELEERRIREALLASAGVQVRAATLLRMPLRTFQVKLKLYGIESGRKRGG